MEARFQEKWKPVFRPEALQPPPSPSPPPSSPPTVVILALTVVILGLVPRICSRRRIPGGRWWILATRARMTERDEGATGGALPGKVDTGFPSGSAPASAFTLTPTVVTLTPTVILGLVPRIYSRRRIPGGRWWILATRARMTERDEGATGGALPGKADTGFPSGSAPASAVILAPTVVTVTPTVVTVTLTAVILTPTVILGLVPRIYSRRRIPGGRWWILATRARMTERGEDAGKDKDIERVRAVQRGRALGPIRAALDLAPSGRTEERPFH